MRIKRYPFLLIRITKMLLLFARSKNALSVLIRTPKQKKNASFSDFFFIDPDQKKNPLFDPDQKPIPFFWMSIKNLRQSFWSGWKNHFFIQIIFHYFCSKKFLIRMIFLSGSIIKVCSRRGEKIKIKRKNKVKNNIQKFHIVVQKIWFFTHTNTILDIDYFLMFLCVKTCFLSDIFLAAKRGIFDWAKCDKWIFLPILNLPIIGSRKQIFY